MNTLLSIKEVDVQLEKEIRINSRSRDRDRTTIQRCGNYSEPGYNVRIYKKNEEMSNIYSSD